MGRRLSKYQTGLIGDDDLAKKFMKLADVGEKKELETRIKQEGKELKKEVQQEIRTKFRERTGNLRKGVSVQKNKYVVRGFPNYVVRMNWRWERKAFRWRRSARFVLTPSLIY